jgi:sugar phosphate isomerase/epimerase
VRAAGLDAVQLALDPLRTGEWPEDDTRTALADAGIAIRSGMMGTEGEDYSTLDTIRVTGGVRPDATWERNLAAAGENARLARRLGLDLVTLHAGFLPEEAGDPERATLLDRLRAVVDAFAAEEVAVAFETGQETAGTLLGVLRELERPTAGVNFDPANMLLYGMGDPVDALSQLAPFVRQIHVKDARRTATPGTWGTEVPVGTGEVDWDAFFEVTVLRGIDGDLMIEREAGDDRVADIRTARELVERELGAWRTDA